MSLNPFATVSDYPSMLNKIATYTFFVSLLAAGIIMWQIPDLGNALPNLPVKIPDTGLKIPMTIVLASFAIAFVSRAVKLHDRLSDLFGIRKQFDILYILVPMALVAGTPLSLEQQEKIRERRHVLMNNVFYKYASSSPGKTQIEQHAVTMALDQWTWYWICVEAMCIFFLPA